MKTLIYGAGLISGDIWECRDGIGLLEEGGTLLKVGPVSLLRAEADHVCNLGDVIILPGFVDAHTHITVRPGEGNQHRQLRQPLVWQALRGVRNLERMLLSGVTTARVMGEVGDLDFHFKDAVKTGEVAGPTLLVSGQALSASHGHGSALGMADGPEDIRKVIRSNLGKGADHIKAFVTGGVSSEGDIYAYHYGLDELQLLTREAHRAGRSVAAHAHGGEGVDLCVQAGVNSIEHGGLLTDANIRRMAEASTWLVLTNAIAFHPDGIELGDAGRPGIVEKMHQVRSTIETTFAKVRASGISFALGTDSMHGLFGFEIEWLVARGVSEADALRAATLHGAKVAGVAQHVGTLEPGKRADIVALKGDPLEDISSVYRVAAVAVAGNLRTVVA